MKRMLETHSAEETYALGKSFGEKAGPGQIICLEGDLGTGKTVFAQGFGEGLGIREIINSPTFTIISIYESGRIPLYHFDVYRIEDPDEMDEIGYEDYFYGNGVVLIEWASRVRELIPENAVWAEIAKDPEKGDDYRRIVITGGEKSC